MNLKMVAIYPVCKVHKYRHIVQDVNGMAINHERSILGRDVHIKSYAACHNVLYILKAF